MFHYRKGRIIDLFNFYLRIPNQARFSETIHHSDSVVIDMLIWFPHGDTQMGRVGFEPTTPAMSRRYLNQARPPALKEEILSPTVSYNIIFQPYVSHLKVFHQTLRS
jgi:hypothetical protein